MPDSAKILREGGIHKEMQTAQDLATHLALGPCLYCLFNAMSLLRAEAEVIEVVDSSSPTTDDAPSEVTECSAAGLMVHKTHEGECQRKIVGQHTFCFVSGIDCCLGSLFTAASRVSLDQA